MANIGGRTLLLAIALAVPVVFASSQAKHLHPGKVRDAVTGRPISEAFAVAFVESADCDQGPALHRLKTEKGGEFTFEIPKENFSFQAKYCKNGYASRREPANSNRVSGSPVTPELIDLIPIMTYSKPRRSATVRGVVTNKLADARADLLYFKSADPEAFQGAVEQLPERLRRVVSDLLEAEIEREEPERAAG